MSAHEALRAGIDRIQELERVLKSVTADRNRIARELTELSDSVSAAIGSVRWMDPPDGGSVTLAEQVGRMRERIEELEGGR